MNFRRLAESAVRDTLVSGVLTVGLAYVLTHSGVLMLGLAGVGLLLVALGGGTAGRVPASGAASAETRGLSSMVEDMGIWSASSDVPVRTQLVFYGAGLVLWSLIVLGTFRSSLH